MAWSREEHRNLDGNEERNKHGSSNPGPDREFYCGGHRAPDSDPARQLFG